MSDVKLNSHVFLASANGTTASPWYPVDYLYTSEQNRTVYVAKASAEVVIETKISANSYDTNKKAYASVVISTVTAVTTANNTANILINWPFTDIRARTVTGTAATNHSTVVGVV
jgi:hypothetical protein